MAGLLSKEAPMEPEADVEEEQPNVSPEEQAQYDAFVNNGMNLIYDKKGMPKMIESLKGDGNPVEGLANTLNLVVMRLEDSAEQSGQKIPGDVMLHGGGELLKLLIEMSEEAGVHEYSPEDEEKALYMAMDMYRTSRQEQGKLPVEQLQGDMQMLQQAEQAGTLDQILPGVQEFAQRSQQQPQQG